MEVPGSCTVSVGGWMYSECIVDVEEKNSCPFPGIKIWFLGFPAHSLVTKLTELTAIHE